MRKQDIKRDASGSSMTWSTAAFMISALGVVAYFMFKTSSQPVISELPVITENYCQDDFESNEIIVEELLRLKTQIEEKWTNFCQNKLDGALYDTAIIKATEGKFSTSFIRLCKIPEGSGSEYFKEAQFLFSLWEQNRNTSGKPQEIRPLLESFFQNQQDPRKNCPAAREVLEKL
ncbi:hypothetical protein SPB21_09145 [Leptothoe sp. ISB3NOV94-8A]|nr:hypothetical protein [Adonisia turfae]